MRPSLIDVVSRGGACECICTSAPDPGEENLLELDVLEDLETALDKIELARQKLLHCPILGDRRMEILYFLRNHAYYVGRTIETVREAI